MSWYNLTQEQLEALPTPRLLNIYKIARHEAHYARDSESTASVDRMKAMLDEREHVGDGDTVNDKTRDPELLYDEVQYFTMPDGTKLVHGTKAPHTDRGKSAARRRQKRAWSYMSYEDRNAIACGASVLTKEGKVRPAYGSIIDLKGAIGQQVCKDSKKPFKSKRVYNTVSGVTVNPHTERKAFTFEEDDSIVDAHICQLRKSN